MQLRTNKPRLPPKRPTKLTKRPRQPLLRPPRGSTVNISTSIAAASSSAATAAAAQTPGPNDPIPNANLGLRPEQLGALAGLRAKLAIDKEAKIQDQEDITELESINQGSI